MAQYRILVSNGDQEVSGGTWAGVKDAFTWYFCGMHFALITAQSFNDFLPSLSRISAPGVKDLRWH